MPPAPSTRQNKAYDHLTSGALSGLASSVALQPLDLIKTRVQQSSDLKGKGREILPTAKQVIQDEGWRGLWRGTIPTVVRNVPGVAVYFYMLSEIRYFLSQTGTFSISPPSTSSSSSSSSASAAASTSTSTSVSGAIPIDFSPPPIPTPSSSSSSTSTSTSATTISSSSSSAISPITFPLPSPSTSPELLPSLHLPSPPIPLTIPMPPRPTTSTTSPIGIPTETTTDLRSASSALPKLSSQGNLIAGAVTRTSVGFVLSPITVVKARYESGLYPSHTLLSSLTDLLRTSGIRGLFQGFTATALRDAPYAGVSVVFYEKGKDVLSKALKPEWNVPYAAIHTLSGMTAATLATLVTSPADCVKTKMQVLPKSNPTIRRAVQLIWAERGPLGFFSGTTLRITRKAASSAIGWSVYEGLLLFLRDRGVVGAGLGVGVGEGRVGEGVVVR